MSSSATPATLANSEIITTDVEEIVINTGGGGDTVIVTGSLDGTGVSQNTITVNGGLGNDTIDLSLRSSNHRVVVDGGGGDDTVVLGFASDATTAYELIEDTGGNVIGVKITHGGFTDDFFGIETLQFTDGTDVVGVNDAPVNHVPAEQTIAEDATLTFSGANTNAISIADFDAGLAELKVKLSVDNGTLTLFTIAGLTFIADAGANGTDTMTFTGTRAAINTALDGLVYDSDADYFGLDTLSITTNDQGYNGDEPTPGDTDDTSEEDIDTVAITVTAVNDAPVAVDDPLSSVAEDSGARTITFAELTGNDSKGPANEAGQSLTIAAVSNPVGGTVAINDNETSGNPSDDFIVFTPSADFNGTASFDYTVQDNGTTNGANDFETDLGNASFTVTAVNDAPVDSVPGTQSVDEDTSLVFSSGNGNLISIADVDVNETASPDNTEQVTLSVVNGALTLSTIADLSFGAGDGTADATMTFTGTVSAINTALAGLSYQGNLNFNGSDTLTITTNDLGHTGIDPLLTDGPTAEQDSDTVTITVHATNDAPVLDLDPADVTAPGSGYELNLLADGNPFPFALTPTIDDADDTQIDTATIVLVDGASGDFFYAPEPALTALGITDAVITGEAGNSADPLTVTLTGPASLANFADAIQQVSFGSTSTTAGDRHIAVTVNDGNDDSNVATATIHVTEPEGDNEAPVLFTENAQTESVRDAGGPEIGVEPAQSVNTLAKLPDGSFWVVWNMPGSVGHDIFGRHFASNGTPLSSSQVLAEFNNGRPAARLQRR